MEPRKLHRSINEIRKLFAGNVNVMPVGSRATCMPPPNAGDVDEDWLILIKQNMLEIHLTLQDKGFKLGGSIIVDEDSDKSAEVEIAFWSYTKGDLNLIVTQSNEFYCKFLKATAISTKLNIMKKENRIHLFQAILYDNW